MQIEIQKTLKVPDLCELYDCAPITMYREVKLIREGKSRHPPPIDFGTGGRRKHQWTKESILAFLNSGGFNASPPVNSTMSDKERKQQYDAAIADIKAMKDSLSSKRKEK